MLSVSQSVSQYKPVPLPRLRHRDFQCVRKIRYLLLWENGIDYTRSVGPAKLKGAAALKEDLRIRRGRREDLI